MRFVERVNSRHLSATDVIKFTGSALCGIFDVPGNMKEEVRRKLNELGCDLYAIDSVGLGTDVKSNIIFTVYTERQLMMLKLHF